MMGYREVKDNAVERTQPSRREREEQHSKKLRDYFLHIAKLSSSWQVHLKLSSIITIPVDPTQPDST